MTQPDETRGSADAVRAVVHAMWGQVAGGWGEYADEADARGAALTEELLARSALTAGDRVLELACGPGGLGLAAAARVGSVVLSDVAPEMVAIAAGRAEARGIDNAHAITLDLEDIDQPDGSYDVVLCREGLMFAVDPARAVAESRRVLRAGGRIAVAVWGPRAENPWLHLVLDAVSDEIGAPVPPLGVPGPFSLDDPQVIHELFVAAGFVDVTVDAWPVPMRSPSFEAWWNRTVALAGPLAMVIGALPDASQVAIAERLEVAVTPYATAHGLEFPGVSLVASGRRP
jgi:SAM-dependent methyltransferase